MSNNARAETRAFRDLRDFVEALAAADTKDDAVTRAIARFPELRDRLVVVRPKKRKKNFRVIHYGREIGRQNGFEMSGLRFSQIKKLVKGTSGWKAGKRSLKNYVAVHRSGVPTLARNEYKVDFVGFGRFSRLTMPVFVDGKIRYIASAVLYEN